MRNVQKQFFKHEKLGYLYRTGDLGFLSSKGYVVFLGRKDFQVKLHGYRIELGEIESCLCRCKNVSEAVAEVKEVNGVQNCLHTLRLYLFQEHRKQVKMIHMTVRIR